MDLDDFDPNRFDTPSRTDTASLSGTRGGVPDIVDLDAPDEPTGRQRTSRDRTRTERPQSTRTARTQRTERPSNNGDSLQQNAVQISARAGYSTYYDLGFITYGGEVSVPVGRAPVSVILGAEAYSVRRDLPPELAVIAGTTTEWNTMFPFNAGLLYKANAGGSVEPYFGADVIGAQYYVDSATNSGSWAIGGRARAGVNLMVASAFGFNINGSVGGWSGNRWAVIGPGIKEKGVLPQISGGTVFSF